jgi:chemotaxis response regulator CheB
MPYQYFCATQAPKIFGKTGNIITTVLLKLSASQNNEASFTTFSGVFSLEKHSSIEEGPVEPGTKAASNRTRIIIGASIGGAVLLVAVFLALAYYVPALHQKIFPHRRGGEARRTVVTI